jgi:thioredoxin reductase (NADPH)
MLTTDVENFPGFAEGVMGPELMRQMRSQAERFGADLAVEKATKVNLSASPIEIWAAEDDMEPAVRTQTLIIATGARSLLLGLPNEARLIGHGVSTCATCDGFFFRDKPIVVVGGGDSALEEALFLTKFGRSVAIVHRRKELRASRIMQDRAFRNEKIEFVWDSAVVDILGGDRVEGIRIKDVHSGHERNLEAEGVFVAIGHVPNTGLFRGQLDMDANGYLLTRGGTKTALPGVFACGDVQDHEYRQAITAAGSGCMAAIDAERYLAALRHGLG